MVFTGYDIVPGNVQGHQEKFSSEPWKFEVCFNFVVFKNFTIFKHKEFHVSTVIFLLVHDIVVEPIQKFDIILSRQTLQVIFFYFYSVGLR